MDLDYTFSDFSLQSGGLVTGDMQDFGGGASFEAVGGASYIQ